MKKIINNQSNSQSRASCFIGLGCLLATFATATPSSTFWAPSTALCQAWGVPHLSYDSYFARQSDYPTDVGLTMGVLPFEKVQGEIGVDLLYPSQDPLYLSAKICTPESTFFQEAPSLGIGVYNMGTHKNSSDYNILYGVLQKTIPQWGVSLSIGFYHGLNKTLLTNSDGRIVQNGFIGAIVSPDIQFNLLGLKKINFVADIQTGKNVLGAWGFGSNLYFSDYVSLLTGPVFFFDKKAQPGGKGFFWTLQLDVDIPLDSIKK